MKLNRPLFALSLTFIAGLLHLYLTRSFYQIRLGVASSSSACNINSVFNCDAVSLSAFSNIFGVPLALFGFITQVVMFILILVAWLEWTDHPQALRKWIFYFASFIAGVSLVMAGISGFVMSTYCLFCIATYLLSFGVLFLTKGDDDSKIKLKNLLEEPKWAYVLFFLIPAFATVSHFISLKNYRATSLGVYAQESLGQWQTNPTQQFSDLGIALGAPQESAKMVIIEYADYLCPFCKTASVSLKAFTESRINKDVRLVFRPFPLDGECNANIPPREGLRCQLAYLTFCFNDQPVVAWRVHDFIFKHQSDWFKWGLKEGVEKLAIGANVPKAKLISCLEDQSVKDMVKVMIEEGVKANLTGTPSVYVNGKYLPQGQMVPYLEAVYRSL